MNEMSYRHESWLKNVALPLQVIATICATILALNFALEVLLFQGIQRDHQILLLVFLIALSVWAIIECFLLQREEKLLPLHQLLILLILQFFVVSARLVLFFFGEQTVVNRVHGVSVYHLGPLFVLIPAYVIVFLLIARALINTYVNEIRLVNEVLQEKNEELKRITKIEVEQSRFKEREQLLQDMHDGFGSQLASIRIMSEQGRLNVDQLPNYLQEITSDLHLIVDTLSQEDMTLESALINMRYRLSRRFNEGSPHLLWDFSLKGMHFEDSRLILHILRVMQEAFNNAIRHANPNNIWLRAIYDQNQRALTVSVRDDGIGMPNEVRRGRGMNNMQQRAREIGGDLEMIDCQPGTEVRLNFFFKPGIPPLG